jgi:hypothetical protein
MGWIAVASAIAGGLAVAWWHRKTLSKLQNPILSADLQNSRFSDDVVELGDSGTDAA